MGYEDKFLRDVDKNLGLKGLSSYDRYILEKKEQEEKDLARKAKDKAVMEKWALQKAEKKAKLQASIEAEIMEKQTVDTIFDDPEILDELNNKAERMVGKLESDVDYEEFAKAGLYPLDEVKADMRIVAIREKEFEINMTPEQEKAKKIATILEAVLAVGITHSEWYGDKVRIYPPSKYDDYENGIDGILEFESDDEKSDYLALGIDVTFRNLKEELFKQKVERLLRKIKEGKPAKVKYFQSYSGELMPEFTVPNIILSFDATAARDLSFNFKNLTNSANKEKLKNHKVRYEIIAQIMGECNLLAEYARKHNQSEIAEAYEAIPKTLEKIAEDNSGLQFLFAEVGRDRVTERIKEIMQKPVL